MSNRIEDQPCEVFAPWPRAQLEVARLAREAPPAPWVLRSAGFLTEELAERIAGWFTGAATTPARAIGMSYRALERETADGPQLGVTSNGAWFPVGPARAHQV